jgi:hypothetical protein
MQNFLGIARSAHAGLQVILLPVPSLYCEIAHNSPTAPANALAHNRMLAELEIQRGVQAVEAFAGQNLRQVTIEDNHHLEAQAVWSAK